MARKRNRKLSTIELTVLGIAWLRGPCTIYVVMKILSQAGSTYHKSRAGTTYSVAHRLLEFGLLEKIEETGDNGEQLVRVSEEGIVILKDWYRPPIPMFEVAFSSDLIRLRFYFMGVLDREERLAFVDDARVGLHTFLERCHELMLKNEEVGDYYGILATLAAIKETEARIEWLEVVRKWVDDPESLPRPWAESVLKS